MELFNLDKLIKIKVLNAIKDKSYVWKCAEKGFLGIGKRKEGFYDNLLLLFDRDLEPLDLNDLPLGRFSNGKSIYIRPRVVFRFQDDYEHIAYFSSYTEALEYAEGFKSDNILEL